MIWLGVLIAVAGISLGVVVVAFWSYHSSKSSMRERERLAVDLTAITRERDYYRAEAYKQRLAAEWAQNRLAKLQLEVTTTIALGRSWGQA